MKRWAITLSALTCMLTLPALAVTAPVSAAAAAPEPFIFPLEQLVTGGAKSVHKLYTRPLEKGYYDVTVRATTQKSVHPETNIIVRAGSSEVRINDIERSGFSTQTAAATLNAPGGDVTVSIQLGRDKVFSGGREVRLQKVASPRSGSSTSSAATTTPSRPAPTAAPRPNELPHTGTAGSSLAGVAGISVIGYGTHVITQRHRLRTAQKRS